MKNFLLFLFLVLVVGNLCLALAYSDTIWWNEDMTRQEAPESEILEAGPAIYGRLEDGATHSGGGYLGTGTWKLLMMSNPVAFIIANNLVRGPRYEIWDQKIAFEESQLRWYIRHYVVTTDIVGGYVDNGGGPRPLYISHFRSVLHSRSSHSLFYGEWKLIYHSRADVNKDKEINILDLAIVGKYFNRTNPLVVPQGHPADVDGNRVVNGDDIDIVAMCFGAEPDDTLLAMLAMVADIFPDAVPDAIAAAAPANATRITTWGRMKHR